MEQGLFRRFCEIAHERAGIRLGKGKEALVSVRVGRRIRALGLDSAKAYLAFLEGDSSGREIVSFLDAMSTNYTFFYREAEHFDALSAFVKETIAAGQRRLRFWCAASSSGEEPYTIAMTLSEAMQGKTVDARLLATDISTDVLKKAMAGLYNDERISRVPRPLLTKYFTKKAVDGEPLYQVSEALRKLVVFKRLNLAEPPFPMSGPLDVVFCRNVMMYLHDSVRAALIEDVARLLRPRGLLILGRCDSLGAKQSKLRHLGQSIYVRA